MDTSIYPKGGIMRYYRILGYKVLVVFDK